MNSDIFFTKLLTSRNFESKLTYTPNDLNPNP